MDFKEAFKQVSEIAAENKDSVSLSVNAWHHHNNNKNTLEISVFSHSKSKRCEGHRLDVVVEAYRELWTAPSDTAFAEIGTLEGE